MKRYIQLICDICLQTPDKHGEVGKWIKATKHSAIFNHSHQGHPDLKGWAWFAEITQRSKNGDISIFKNGKFNWFVLPGHEAEFRHKYMSSKRIHLP
ncbi:hypothetical protein KJ766_01025 [Patescibacteria group bacterium]|nr:hypothetical protein [Patescibacteria group bacterium]